MSTEFIELAGEVNWTMPYFCAEKVARALNDEAMPVRGSRVAIIGVGLAMLFAFGNPLIPAGLK